MLCDIRMGRMGGFRLKKLLTVGLLACLFLVVLLGIFARYLKMNREEQEVNAQLHNIQEHPERTLCIYPGELSEEFSPLDYQTQGDENVLVLCFDKLTPERGIRMEKVKQTAWFNELTHAYTVYDEGQELWSVVIEVNPEAKTAKGDRIDARDILFNLYLRCDISSGVSDPFGGVSILGQEEYAYGTEDIERRKKELEQRLTKPSEELQERLRSEIVEKELRGELQWVKGLYQEEAYEFISSKYDKPKDLFAYYYSYETAYSSDGKSEEEVLDDIIEQYGWDYRKLSKVTGTDHTAEAEHIALSMLLAEEGRDEVKSIAGIEKIDDITVKVTYLGEEKDAEKLCDIWLLPLAEYGDGNHFDAVESFGFRKGAASVIRMRSFQKFSGSGAYYTKRMGKKRLVLRKNVYYLKGKAKIKKLWLMRKEYEKSQELIEDMLQRKVDLAVARDSEELEKLMASRATGASYAIRKRKIDTSQPENCFLYRTSYVNAPSLPEKLTGERALFEEIYKLRIN